jgi:hypothetical protein
LLCFVFKKYFMPPLIVIVIEDDVLLVYLLVFQFHHIFSEVFQQQHVFLVHNVPQQKRL